MIIFKVAYKSKHPEEREYQSHHCWVIESQSKEVVVGSLDKQLRLFTGAFQTRPYVVVLPVAPV